MIVTDGKNFHYILIKCLSTFLRVNTKHNKSCHTCEFCFRVFKSILSYMKHVGFCKTGKPSIEMPLENDTLKFENYKYKIPNPVTIYADFEAYNIQAEESVTTNTKILCEQRPTGFGYIVVSPYEQFSKPVFVYRGEDAADFFVERLLTECSEVESVLKHVKPMEFTTSDQKHFLQSVNCSICGEALDWERETICRDHCHITGRFRFVSPITSLANKLLTI